MRDFVNMITYFFTATPSIVESRFRILTDHQRAQLVRARALGRKVRIEISQYKSSTFLWGVDILDEGGQFNAN